MVILTEVIRYSGRILLALTFLVLTTGSSLRVQGTRAEVRRYTRPLEFDFVEWTIEALVVKLGEYGLNSSSYLSAGNRQAVLEEFLRLQGQEGRIEAELSDLYGQPELEDRAELIAQKIEVLTQIERERRKLQPTAEAVLQQQVAVILAEQGFNLGGKNFPPVAFHSTALPYALIVSPRDEIRQVANVQLETDLSLERRVALEDEVAEQLDASTLVVPVGGYGTYPTMVQQTANLPWLTEVVVHEWIHNYLTLRPLGLRYEVSPELRTMNETAATLLGQAWGRQVLARYYPQTLATELPASNEQIEPVEPEATAFDFREEMRITRERVDELLKLDQVEAAEDYMERRRLIFWENGFRIRKLNQAYFAFHGSYAAEPGGAAGDDPVGEAVRELWVRIDNPGQFLRQMAWMTGPADLEKALGRKIEKN